MSLNQRMVNAFMTHLPMGELATTVSENGEVFENGVLIARWGSLRRGIYIRPVARTHPRYRAVISRLNAIAAYVTGGEMGITTQGGVPAQNVGGRLYPISTEDWTRIERRQ